MACPTPSRHLALPDVRCSERYMSEVACGNHTFLFSRRDQKGDHKSYETLVRVRRSTAPARYGMVALTTAYSAAEVALPASFLMSHNAAFMCVGAHIIAYGGMHHLPTSEDWMGNDIGIVRRSASASSWPLKWSEARPVLSGDKAATGCVDRINNPCEYDGKLSVVRFRSRTLLFSRSNVSPEGGHRHVQVAHSPDGMSSWSRFAQLQIEGVAPGAWEIYFFCVRRVGSSALARMGALRGDESSSAGSLLLGLFPATSEEGRVAGIYMTTSASRDGTQWSRPRMLKPSRHMGHGRTGDYPVDGQPLIADALRVLIQHRIDLRDYAAEKDADYDHDCDARRVGWGRTHVCEQSVPAAQLLEFSEAGRGTTKPSRRAPVFGFPMRSLPRPSAMSSLIG